LPARDGSPARKVPKAMAERKDDISEDQPFLSRWSERKRHSEPDPQGGRADTDPEQAESADAGTADEELAANQAAAEAIDIDGLDEDSDYSPYLKDGVPADLKSAALQRLWRSNPVFANVDGLNDYDEDFTIPKTPMGAIKTAWKFGRGFLTDDDLADKDGTTPDPQTVETGAETTAETGDGDEETVAEAITSEPDPSSPDPVSPDPVSPDPVSPDPVSPDPVSDEDTDRDRAADFAPEEPGDERPDPLPAPGVGLRNRLDMAAFSTRDDD